MSTKNEREEKRRQKDKRERENLVSQIISSGEGAGKVYSKYDRMRLDAFHNKDIGDYELNGVLEEIDRLEKKEIRK